MFARAFAYHLQQLRPDWEIRLFDAGAELPDRGLPRLFVEHWKTILAMPGFIKNCIFALEPLQGGISHAITLRIIQQSAPDAMALLQEWQPNLILSTHWGCTHLFAQARDLTSISADQLPLWYVYTEFGRAYRLINCRADRYFTISERSSVDLERVGVSSSAISRIDLFVPPELSGKLPSQQEARRQLDLDPNCFTVLFSLGGEGIGHIQDYLEAYERIGKKAQFIVICGRNEELVATIRKHFPDQKGFPRFRPLGYQKNLRVPLAAADIIAGKAGTSSVIEAITLRKPLIVCKPGAPNENDNMAYIVEKGFGWHRPQPWAFASLVESLADPADTAGQAELTRVKDALNARPDSNGASTLVGKLIDRIESGAMAC